MSRTFALLLMGALGYETALATLEGEWLRAAVAGGLVFVLALLTPRRDRITPLTTALDVPDRHECSCIYVHDAHIWKEATSGIKLYCSGEGIK